jgi:hypothetical protein
MHWVLVIVLVWNMSGMTNQNQRPIEIVMDDGISCERAMNQFSHAFCVDQSTGDVKLNWGAQ